MEYRVSTDTNYTKVTGPEISGLKTGVYYVRYAARPGYYVGPDTAIVLNEKMNDYQYTTSGKDIVITEYIRSEPDVLIPDCATIIRPGAFVNCTNMKNVTIPNSVTNLDSCGGGGGSFSACSNLTSVNIPESVTHVGEYAFYDRCLKLYINQC